MKLMILAVAFTSVLPTLGTPPAIAGGKVGLYAIYMNPYGIDAKNYSRPGWGLGGHVVVPLPQLYNILAGTGGAEIVNLLSQSVEGSDVVGGVPFPYTQQTYQNYFRFYIGAQLGGHGEDFFRPHAGMNIAWVFYGISTDIVIQDEGSPGNEIRKNQSSVYHGVFGYDLSVGLDLNFNNKIALDAGVKYLKSFSLPLQLGEGSVTVYPQYVQIYLGAGIPFEVFSHQGDQGEEANPQP